MSKRQHTWAIYNGTKMIAEGSAVSLSACTRPSIEAAYKDAVANGCNPKAMGSEAISGYRISIWGPRGGNLEYMKPVI